jgi:hypothetical protein
MKIIFLDFDGVLNSNEFNKKANLSGTLDMSNVSWWVEMVDPIAVARLNTIIEKTDAKVVVSSSWRLYNSVEMLTEILHHVGFKGEIIDLTPKRYDSRRGKEIKKFLETTPIKVDKFVVIDDDEDIWPFELKTVQTDIKYGLLDDHVDQAIKMLNE